MKTVTESPESLDTKQLVELLHTDEKTGLTGEQAAELLQKFGPNELKGEEATPLWKLVLEQFDDPLVKILLGSAVFSFAMALSGSGDHSGNAFVEPFIILVILVLNAIVGVWQEHNAENALEALKRLQPKNCIVIRGGVTLHEFDASGLVPGDLVEVKVGDKVPADMRVVRLLTTTLRVDESALTGESATVLKQTESLAKSDKSRISDRHNMVFSGTCIAGGRAQCLVVNTGMSTEIGLIQKSVSEEESERTPLKVKLDEFGDMLAKVIGVICFIVFVMNYKKWWDPVHGGWVNGMVYYVKIAVALGVAAIPEGLPAVITLCLALGTRKMVKKNAIIRRLPSVETLGCTTVICSDKTGTLTMNEMTAVTMVHVLPGGLLEECKVLGTSYNPKGQVDGTSVDANPALEYFAATCVLCNDSVVQFSEATEKYERQGEPTEAAVRVLGEKLGFPGRKQQSEDKDLIANETSLYFTSKFHRVATLEFSRGRKSMSVIAMQKNGSNMLFCKGAPESVLERCKTVWQGDKLTPLNPKAKDEIMQKVHDLAGRPLRVLALAIKSSLPAGLSDYNGPEHASHKLLCAEPDSFVSIESDMEFVGLVGIKDPARPEVAGSIERCRDAGIRVMMITGDNRETAEAIATEIGIFRKGEDLSGKSFTGQQFEAMTTAQQQAVLAGPGGRVFSRTDPKDKQTIVKLLKDQGEVAAMTGDGVNDAPALKAASIGIAMGITGTEVAKEASDMVLADDNFATIVSAVEEGRAIYCNMKAFIRYLISSNIGEVTSIFFTAALGLPEGLVPVQLLWVNLVTDGPPATALGFNPADPDIMKKPPRRSDESLINAWVFFRYLVIGIYVGIATVGSFIYWYVAYDWANDHHTLVTFDQLSSWGHCSSWTGFQVANFGGMDFSKDPCTYFTTGKVAASTISLTVLVTIEMFNAMNAVSEDGSLLTMPPWTNPWLVTAILASFGVHFLIMYVPFLASMFNISPLDLNDWMIVLAWSFPVIIIDELLKFVGRQMNASALEARKKEN